MHRKKKEEVRKIESQEKAGLKKKTQWVLCVRILGADDEALAARCLLLVDVFIL